MPRKKPVHLPSREFSSRDEAAEFFSSMLGRYRDGESVSEDDDRLLYELLLRHPDAIEKIGSGIARFYRARAEQGTSCFHIERTDGTRTDFSLNRCITSKLQDLKVAHFQTHADAYGRVPCVRTGELVSIGESELRHASPVFRDIVSEFIECEQIQPQPELMVPSGDLQYRSRFASDELAARFQEFHRSRRVMFLVKSGIR
jgi:Protein of unknown function (DUF3223)